MKPTLVTLLGIYLILQGCTTPPDAPELNNPRDPYSSLYSPAGPYMEQPYVWGEHVMVTWRRQDFYCQENRIERKVHQDSAFVVISTVSGSSVNVFDYGPFTSGATYYYRVISTSLNGKSYTSNTVSLLLP